jgi:glycosyltransferase involved in cell wall biosynthesis
VIDEGETGYLVPIGDEAALRDRATRLRDDPATARACGERARTVAITRFSAARMQRDYLELYARVLGSVP